MTCDTRFGKKTQQEAVKAYIVLGTLKLEDIYQLDI